MKTNIDPKDWLYCECGNRRSEFKDKCYYCNLKDPNYDDNFYW